jgi:RHS repeat-associated protein
VEKNNGSIVETRLYLGGFEIFRKKDATGALALEQETLHIMDDVKRIAIVETKTYENGSPILNPIPAQRYQLSNNIESAALELDENAQIISYEEYYPYGDTSYQAGRDASEVSQKRYRYTGKEKDEESGLYYMLARYYAGWLGRWTAADPAGLVDGVNLYAYCSGNPLNRIDPNGMFDMETRTIEKGDTLSGITKQINETLGTKYSINEIAGTNKIKDPDLIYAGNKIILPDSETSCLDSPMREKNEFNIASSNINGIIYTDEFAKAWIGRGKSYQKALELISENRLFIEKSAKNWKIDPQAIASVIFQEKFFGVWADAKNFIGAVKLVWSEDYSFGITEMQVSVAKRLLKERGEEGSVRQAISWLSTNSGAIDLTAQYLRELQNEINETAPHSLAQAYNIGAKTFNKGKYSYVGRRSKLFQKEISKALKGDNDEKK